MFYGFYIKDFKILNSINFLKYKNNVLKFVKNFTNIFLNRVIYSFSLKSILILI